MCLHERLQPSFSTQSATFTVAAVPDLSEQVFIIGKPNPGNITSYERHPDSK